MKRMMAIFAFGIFAMVFADDDSVFTLNAITFSEHYPYPDGTPIDSLPEWSIKECSLAEDSNWSEICEARFVDCCSGRAYFSRIDSSVGITHSCAEGIGNDSLYHSWQFWRVGNNEKFPMTRVIIDEFKMYHECGFLNMPWADADSIIRHIVFEFMLSGDTTVDWGNGDCFNASGLETLDTRCAVWSKVTPGEEKKSSVWMWGTLSLPSSVSSLMQTTAFFSTKLSSSFRISKTSPNRFSIDGLSRGTPYRIFDLNGNLLQRETWNGEVITVNRVPAVLQVQGKAFLLK